MQNDVAVDGGRDSGERGELLPCPFCGFKNAKCLGDDHPTWRLCRVACITMNCGVGGANYNTRAEAIAAWNRRALSRTPDLLAKLERMSDLDVVKSNGQEIDDEEANDAEWIKMIAANMRKEFRSLLTALLSMEEAPK